MSGKREYEKHFAYMSIIGVVIIMANLYYYAHPLLRSIGATVYVIDLLFLKLREGGIFNSSLLTKALSLIFLSLGVLAGGRRFDSAPKHVVAMVGAASALFYFFHFSTPLVYLISTVMGMAGLFWTLGNLGLSGFGDEDELNDREETFDQCRKLIVSDYSINIPMKFRWQHKWHDGWINIVNPFRGILVMGTPGSGKSYSVYGPIIEQLIAKGCSMYVYDYKYPDLTRQVYNELLLGWPKDKPVPQFVTVDFNDPIHSNRCNPLLPELLTDISQAFSLAGVIMDSIKKGADNGDDFFKESATNFLGLVIWFLRIYKGGIYCTFPHVIELMSQDYKKVFPILASYPEMESQMAAFMGAYEGGAQEQLQGQLATAQVPIVKFISPKLYWVMSGNDFSLKINDPNAQKIFCIGNDPDNKLVYGTAISLISAKLFNVINVPGQAPCALLLDEMPTALFPEIAFVVNTGRSNKIIVVMGVQDKSQVKEGYGDKRAEVIDHAPGNLICGQVNGTTAEDVSKVFGSHKKVSKSLTEGDDSKSINIAFENEEVLPRSVIETFSQGMFCGKVADDFRTPIRQKLFCGMIQRDPKVVAAKQAKYVDIPVLTDFGEEEVAREVDDQGIALIAGEVREKILNESTIIPTESELEEQTQEIIDNMPPAVINQRMAQLYEDLIKANMQRQIMQNFIQVKKDIKNIIDSEYAESGQEPDPRDNPETNPEVVDPFDDF